MVALGLSSKREITRTRVRVRTAMAAQTLEQGRYLGGRPPYGYRLADAGPHPNKAHAAWGRRAHRLEPDPVTAPVVSWMFAPAAGRAHRCADHPGSERCRGAVPVGGGPGTEPAPGRVPGGRCGRSRRSWLTLVIRGGRCGTGSRPRRSWPTRPTPGWGTSRCSGGTCPRDGSSRSIPRTPALVSEADFIAAQDTTAPRGPAGPAVRRYLLAGLHRVRAVRTAAGIGVVLWQARLPVPPRVLQRDRPRSRAAEERLCPRGPDPAAPGRYRHLARRVCRDIRTGERRIRSGDRPCGRGRADRPAARRWHRPHLRPGWPDPARRRPRRAAGRHRQGRH